MSSTRIKKIGGIYTDEDFEKIIRQLNGRAVLVVMIINSNCDECSKLLKFVQQLENGFIDRLGQLVLIYGMSDKPVSQDSSDKKEKKAVEVKEDPDPPQEQKPPKPNGKGRQQTDDKKALGDSRFLVWQGLPSGHGYSIFTSQTDVLTYTDIFDHDEVVNNIVDNIRRFKSSVKTIEGLAGKRNFIQNRRTGIIIETSGATHQSQIMEIEEKVKILQKRLPTSVYFCKGITQEICYVEKGIVTLKKRGLNLEKFIKKIPKKAAES